MKLVLLITFSLISIFAFGQNVGKKLKNVQTIEQANLFIESNSNLSGELLTYSSDKDTLEIHKYFF